MKKIILVFLFLCLQGFVLADSDLISNENIAKIQKHIDEVGFKLLNSNGIEKRTTFNFNTSRVKNACSYHRNREIVIYRDLYNRLESEDELAYILGH
jgi:Zn-dependent protease with chaperone function